MKTHTYKIRDSNVNQWTSDGQLSDWANDPNCENQDFVKGIIEARTAARTQANELRAIALEQKRAGLTEDPFDDRAEVSADAKFISKRIVTHMWIIFVLLPIVIAILFELLSK